MEGEKDGRTDGRRREEKGERQTLRRDKERVCVESALPRVRRAHVFVACMQTCAHAHASAHASARRHLRK